MKTIAVNPSKCTGCRLCELACSLRNAGEFNPTKSRIHVMGYDEFFTLPMTCFQCEKPYCAEVCPTNAISKDQSSGIVSVAKEKCVGCKMCVLACPFGNIVFSSDTRVAVKCEQCDGEPECVLFCEIGALEYREAEAAAISKKATWSEKIKALYEGA